MKLFLVAIGLVMILEGVPYFLSPKSAKEITMMIQEMEDKTLRIIGFVLMMIGLGIVALTRLWLYPQ